MNTFTDFEEFATAEIRIKIVNAVFGSMGRLSKDARNTIQDVVGPINGFRSGQSIPKDVLKANYNKRAKRTPDIFFTTIMPAWVEANPDLARSW